VTRNNNRRRHGLAAVLLCLFIGSLVAPTASAAREAVGDRDLAEGEFAARRLLKTAIELIELNETERGVKMLETIIDQNPDLFVRYEAHLELGKFYVEKHDTDKAIKHLLRMKELEGDELLTGSKREVYLEAMYLTGIAYYRQKQYGSAFPILRKITRNYPNTVWANQAYYYIGMCHFVQRNWKKAVDALRMVGTFVDPDSPTIELVEANRRFYIKVEDADLPVLQRLDKESHVQIETSNGDTEKIRLIPLSEQAAIFIGSIPTEIGAAVPGDRRLQITGGTQVKATYLDDNTKAGEKDVPREMAVRVVSTASLRFTLGTYDTPAVAAFIGQPLFIELKDVDHDTSGDADSVSVRVVSRYKMTDQEMDEAGIADDDRDGEKAYRDRDEVTVTLTEAAQEAEDGTMQEEGNIHSGRFLGRVPVIAHQQGEAVDKTDGSLAALVDDQIVVTYVDELHIDGESPIERVSKTRVAGEIEATPRATQSVVYDPILRTRKFNVEATAFLELARIFKSMGLRDGSALKADEGLDRTDSVLKIAEDELPKDLRQEAFKLKWELHIVKEDYGQAIATCRLFNEMYPDSPFVDQALMGIATIKFESKDYAEAIDIFKQVLVLENSQAKAEAQYMIARATEDAAIHAVLARQGDSKNTLSQRDIEAQALERAVPAYQLCAEKYPDSEYAGEALAKLVDYYINTRDYAQADDLLERIFVNYPDAQFLDKMLLKWVQVAYRQGNVQKSYDKCQQLIFDYPESPYAGPARNLLTQIEKKLQGSS